MFPLWHQSICFVLFEHFCHRHRWLCSAGCVFAISSQHMFHMFPFPCMCMLNKFIDCTRPLHVFSRCCLDWYHIDGRKQIRGQKPLVQSLCSSSSILRRCWVEIQEDMHSRHHARPNTMDLFTPPNKENDSMQSKRMKNMVNAANYLYMNASDDDWHVQNIANLHWPQENMSLWAPCLLVW